MVAKQRKTELKVVFDTNVLYTQVASDLLRGEVAELLLKPIDDPNLTVNWFLPELVLRERAFQMVARATELLPGLSKLERVLGHNLGITPEIVQERIVSTVDRQCRTYNIQVLRVNYQQTNWEEVVNAAIERKPPFETGQKEKGFRDALAIEAFMQEVDRSPKTPSVCRLAFVSEDALVREAVGLRTVGLSNVRILADLEELKSLINTLTSEVSEEYVNELKPKASLLFFDEAEKTGLYYSAEVPKRIREQFKDLVEALPPGATSVKQKMNYIADPTFLEKVNSTIFWQTRITVEQELLRPNPPEEVAKGLLDPSLWKPLDQGKSALSAGEPNALLRALERYQANVPKPYDTRKLGFHAKWSTRVNTRLQLSAPKLINLAADAPAA